MGRNLVVCVVIRSLVLCLPVLQEKLCMFTKSLGFQGGEKFR